jgi:hypothetical protein
MEDLEVKREIEGIMLEVASSVLAGKGFKVGRFNMPTNGTVLLVDPQTNHGVGVWAGGRASLIAGCHAANVHRVSVGAPSTVSRFDSYVNKVTFRVSMYASSPRVCPR